MSLSPEDLEMRIKSALRGLPDRRAPVTLEARVLAEIRRRAELPWWRQSHAHWPAPARGAFFILSLAVAGMSIAGFFALSRTVEARAAQLANAIFHAIPPIWVYGLLTVLVACYATVIGVGAAAYRALSTKV